MGELPEDDPFAALLVDHAHCVDRQSARESPGYVSLGSLSEGADEPVSDRTGTVIGGRPWSEPEAVRSLTSDGVPDLAGDLIELVAVRGSAGARRRAEAKSVSPESRDCVDVHVEDLLPRFPSVRDPEVHRLALQAALP